MRLISPANGCALAADSPHSLSDGVGRWPVVDGIAYLRVGRDEIVAETLDRLDRGDRTGGLGLLLADQDDWWRGPVADPDAVATLIGQRDRISLRDAMRLLSWGPVADYFAHRWSDPTFVAGLGLVEAHWNGPATSFEIACGIGHHLRALAQRGVAVAGGDVVFAKLWLARHWIVPEADLVCFDAARAWPVRDATFDLVVCHDAFYFLEPKREILARMRRMAGGRLLISHVHNRDWPNMSAGRAISVRDLETLFPDAVFYDDAELSSAVADGRLPVASPAARLGGAEAFAIAEGPGLAAARPVSGGVTLPASGRTLRRNPLYGEDGVLRWPSERYRDEYGNRATYPERTGCPAVAVSEASVEPWARRRELLDLPERW